jgi:peptide/nickel transport system permease protein
MNQWQTPYGDPLISTLLAATLHTLVCCALALGVALLIGGVIAAIWHQSRGLLAHAICTVVGLMDAMGMMLPPLAVLTALQIKSDWAVSLVLGAMTWNVVAAFLKEESDALAKAAFVQVATALGAPHSRVLLRHIIPHIFARLSPLLLGLFGGYIGLLGALGFLGVAGDARQLGFMIYDAKSFVRQNPAYFTGALICFLILILVPHLLVRLCARRSISWDLRSRLA